MLSRFQTSIRIEAPPARVFSLLSDPARFTEWKTGIASIPEIHGSLREPGGWYVAIMTTGGRKTPVRFVIEEADAPWWHVQHGQTAEGVRPRLETWSRHRLEQEGEGTHLHFTFEYTLPLGALGALLDRVLIRKRLVAEFEGSHRRLKEMAEAHPVY